MSDKEVFVDGGAFIGDTVEAFLEKVNSKFTNVYSFEPDQSKHSLFKAKFDQNDYIKLLPYGLWSEKDVLEFEIFEDNPGGNRVSTTQNQNTLSVPVISIDETLQNQAVTFIKMDIEGSELEALEGARQSIQLHRPKLAICVYHHPMDIVNIPIYIKSLVPEYKFYLRHYSNNQNETVLYAVCES